MRAIKALGQNFLVSTKTIEKIVSYTCDHSGSNLVEIGPGKGALTLRLAEQTQSLTCIEKDSLLAFELADRCKNLGFSHVTVLNQNALAIDPLTFINEPYDLVGSLPFNISKRIIHTFLCSRNPYPSNIFAVVQAEVGEKYTSLPPKGSALGLVARVYSTVKKVFFIPRTHFSPIPEVDAIFLHFERKIAPPYHRELSDFIHQVFRTPRKQVRNTLKHVLISSPESKYTGHELETLLSKRAAQLSDENIKNLFFMYNSGYSNEPES